MSKRFSSGQTNISLDVRIVDDTGLPVTGLVAATFPDVKRSSGTGADATITLSDLTALTDAHSDGGVKERGDGVYRLDIPDQADGTHTIRGEATGKRLICEDIQVGDVVIDEPSVRAAIGMGSANLDTQFNSLPDAVTDAIETEYALQQDTNDTIYQAIKYGGRPLVVSTVAGTPTSTEIRTTSVPLEAVGNDSFFGDAQFYIASGPGKGQPPRPVLSFSTPSSGVYIFTFDEPWIVLPEAGDTVGMLLNHTHPKTQAAAAVWSAAGRTLSGTLGSFDATWLKIKAWLRLALRSDAAIATDHATELAEINQDMGTGAGTYDPVADSDEARAEAIAEIAAGTLTAASKAKLDRSAGAILTGTVGVGSTTTTIVTSALSVAGTAASQLNGRIVIFDDSTTTAALRGQATDITSITVAALPVITVTALTTAPASTDTFTIT